VSVSHVRDHLIQEIEKSVVGPYFGDNEVLPNRISPTGTYWSGVLYPKETPIQNEEKEDDRSTSRGDETESEQIIPNIGLKPSSFGLTCAVKSDCKEIQVKINYGLYEKIDNVKSKRKSYQYQRNPFSVVKTIKIGDNEENTIFVDNERTLLLKYYIRKQNNSLIVTVFLLNENISHADEFKNIYRKCFFQPKIKLLSKNDEEIFIDSSDQINKKSDNEDEMLLQLLFNSKKNFAVGHGCAVKWDVLEQSNARSWLETTFLPQYEVPVIEPFDMNFEGLFMEKLFKVEKFSEYKDLLEPIANTYEKWINSLDEKMKEVPKGFEKTAGNQKRECENALSRIREGIKLVSENKIAGEAFAFTNHVMYLQRAHGQWALENSRDIEGKIDGVVPKKEHFENIRWRLFQLAFVLLNIKSIIDPKSDDRNIADLLWFPTGGGKTEAYLGLIAFTLAHRRLRYGTDEDARKYGVTVIMRYTLRLLTLQQFQRAVLLMCACESKRRKDARKWGTEPFSVGLWVGANTTPNVHDGDYGSINAIYRVRDGKPPKEHNPIQLLSCPWCGAKLGGWEYHVSDKKEAGIKQCRISCSNNKCMFSSRKQDQGIPALVVDEDIYSRCPSLIIGTVDKFAQISWNEKTAMLFGKADKYCEKHGFVISNFMESGCNHSKGNVDSWELPDGKLEPPELIVQDELHLISGPLGTLTGIYETAIDYLCTNDEGVSPKIIASTATTKKSREQILGLFNRENSKIFPPQGFKFGDSFFAKEIPLTEKRGKMYLGVCATSRSGITVQAKIASSVLRKIRYLKENLELENLELTDLDEFYTLVAYFNSMKELGNASKMYDDSVPGFIDTIHRKFERNEDDIETTKNRDHKNEILKIKELTSRKRADDIPQILQALEVPINSVNPKPTDALLCTNMLSVGVDVSRLGVMIINGQPKNHAEYIQASGRVGRGFPGLIVTNYSFLKPRDLSHYENFNLYHSTFHMNVEPVSLTPFSPRSRDRALFGIMVAMIRMMEKRLARNSDAQSFDYENQKWIKEKIALIKMQIQKRVEGIDKSELEETMKEFDANIKNWYSNTKDSIPLYYKKIQHPKAKTFENRKYLMSSDYTGEEFPIFVPNSLRDAESGVNLFYMDENLGKMEKSTDE
jgi:hypothetical protein